MSSQTWVQIGVIASLFGLLFWPNLRRLWLKTNPFNGEPNWGHAVVVPAVGLYYLFIHREALAKARGEQFIWGSITRPGRWVAAVSMLVTGALIVLACRGRLGTVYSLSSVAGYTVGLFGLIIGLLDWSLGTTLFGLAIYVYGIYPGQNDYLKDVGMIVTLFGIVLLVYGQRVMRVAWFPIVFLICAIPWPGLVYSWVAEPLQQIAANVAVLVLKTTGVDALCSGTKIVIQSAVSTKPNRVLNVAEACAGMRSLMTFITIGGAVAFLPSRKLWQQVIIVVSAVPIAISCNVMRISGQGLLDHYVSPEWSESFAHQFVGMIMLLPAFFMILGVGKLLDKLFIEEADDPYVLLTPNKAAVKATAGPRTQPAPAAVAVLQPSRPVVKTATQQATPAVRTPMTQMTEQPRTAPAMSVAAPQPRTPVPQHSPAGVTPTPPRVGSTPPRPRHIPPVAPRAIVPPRQQPRGPFPSTEESR